MLEAKLIELNISILIHVVLQGINESLFDTTVDEASPFWTIKRIPSPMPYTPAVLSNYVELVCETNDYSVYPDATLKME